MREIASDKFDLNAMKAQILRTIDEVALERSSGYGKNYQEVRFLEANK
jgi:hypothetical protein